MSAAASIHERMVAILKELPPVGKDQRNQQQGFMFRGHDDVMNALNPLLGKHGVFVSPDVLERVPSQRTTSKGGVMFEVNLHVRFRFYGALGDYVEASAWGEGTDSGDKSTNKAMTMAFKNVLNQVFAISNKETQDADADTPPESVDSRPTGAASAGDSPPPSGGGESPQNDEGTPAAAPASPATLAKFQRYLDNLNAVKEKDWALRANSLAETRFGVTEYKDATDAQVTEIVGALAGELDALDKAKLKELQEAA